MGFGFLIVVYNCLNIRCDLEKDLNRCAKDWLAMNGFKYKSGHVLDAFHQFLNVQQRLVTVKPRQVFCANELKCPSAHKENLKRLLKKVDQGESLNPHLSRQLLDAAYTDAFLADFGLHHFHLSHEIQSNGKGKGFVKRTGPILIALVRNDAFYAIDVRQHGREGDPYLWVNEELLEVIHKNWPDVLKLHRVKGCVSLQEKLTKEERYNLRKRCANTFISMSDGAIYMGPGGGLTAANTATNITREGDIKREFVHSLLNAVVQVIAEKQPQITEQPIRLQLIKLGWPFVFVDRCNGLLAVVSEGYNYQQVRVALMQQFQTFLCYNPRAHRTWR